MKRGIPMKTRTRKQKWYTRTGWIIALLIFFFPVGCFLMWKYKKDSWNLIVKIVVTILGTFWFLSAALGGKNNTSETEQTLPTTPIESVQSESIIEPEPTTETEVQTDNIMETEIETEEVNTPEQTIQTEYIVQTETPVIETESPEIIVYITNTGSKYHRSSCRHLSESKIETTLSNALASGYGPCGTCKPPTQ